LRFPPPGRLGIPTMRPRRRPAFTSPQATLDCSIPSQSWGHSLINREKEPVEKYIRRVQQSFPKTTSASLQRLLENVKRWKKLLSWFFLSFPGKNGRFSGTFQGIDARHASLEATVSSACRSRTRSAPTPQPLRPRRRGRGSLFFYLVSNYPPSNRRHGGRRVRSVPRHGCRGTRVGMGHGKGLTQAPSRGSTSVWSRPAPLRRETLLVDVHEAPCHCGSR